MIGGGYKLVSTEKKKKWGIVLPSAAAPARDWKGTLKHLLRRGIKKKDRNQSIKAIAGTGGRGICSGLCLENVSGGSKRPVRLATPSVPTLVGGG